MNDSPETIKAYENIHEYLNDLTRGLGHRVKTRAPLS
jgi:hypothetical protein